MRQLTPRLAFSSCGAWATEQPSEGVREVVRVTGEAREERRGPETGKQSNSKNVRDIWHRRRGNRRGREGNEPKAKDERETKAENKKEIDWDDGRRARRSQASETKAIIRYTMFLSLCLSAAPMGDGRRCEWAASCRLIGPVPSLTSSSTGCSPGWATWRLERGETVRRVGQVFICASQWGAQTHVRKETTSRMDPLHFQPFFTQTEKDGALLAPLIFSLSINNSGMSVYCTPVNGNQHLLAAKLQRQHHLPSAQHFSTWHVFYCMTNWPVTYKTHLAFDHISISNTIPTPPWSMLASAARVARETIDEPFLSDEARSCTAALRWCKMRETGGLLLRQGDGGGERGGEIIMT